MTSCSTKRHQSTGTKSGQVINNTAVHTRPRLTLMSCQAETASENEGEVEVNVILQIAKPLKLTPFFG